MKKVIMYTVMIASPSDVQQERNATEDVIRKYNAEVRLSNSLHRLETARWELDVALGVADNPQELIDEDVTDTADLVVGVFSTKLGTKSEKDESYTIGELKRCAEANKPVLILFNDAPIPRTANMTEAQKVIDFRDNIEKYLGKNALYATYNGINNFPEVFRNELTKAVNKMLKTRSDDLRTFSKETLVDSAFLLSETERLLSQQITSDSQSFILWKTLLEDYLKKEYGVNSDIWNIFSQISYCKNTSSWSVEVDECRQGLAAAKTFLSQIL